MRRLGWTLRQRGGRPLALALTVLLAALAGDAWLAPQWRDQAQQLRGQALAVQRELRDAELQRQPAARAARIAADPVLPAADTASSRMADLLGLALLNGVSVQRLQRAGSGGADAAARTTLVMPVRAPYADLRRFIAQALRDDTALALERVSLRRNRSDAAELEGELQWALLHRAAGATAAP
jgi:hypothetical protein